MRRSILSKASKVTETDVNERRNNVSPSNGQGRLVRTIGLGRRKSRVNGELEEPRGDATVRSFRSFRSFRRSRSYKSTGSRGKGNNATNEEEDWEVVEQSKDTQHVSKQDEQSEDKGYTETEEKESIIDIAADAADRTLLFIGSQIHRAVCYTTSVLNK